MLMKILKHIFTNYKRFSALLLSITLLTGSFAFIYQKENPVEAAIIDCATTVGNLVQNCSFENPTGSIGLPINANQDVLDNGDVSITSWSTFDDGVKQGNVGTIFNNDPFYIPAQGDRLIDVSGHTSNPDFIEKTGMGIQQTIIGLTNGKTYEIIFSQGYSTLLHPSKVTVLIDNMPSIEGVGGFNVNNNTAGTTNFGSPFPIKWKEQRTTFIANGTSAIIGFRGEITQQGRGDFIDNIIVKEVADTVAPTLTITQPSNGAVVSGPFNITICPSEPITGFTLSDITITNGTASGLTGPTVVPTSTCIGGEIYTATVTPITEGVVSIGIPASSITDTVGNPNTTPSNTVSINYDVTPPIFLTAHIESNNPVNTSYATTGDTVTITWTVDVGGPDAPAVSNDYAILFSGLSTLSPVSCSGSPVRSCSATIIVGSDAPEGLLNFSLSAENNSVLQIQDNSTDGSFVIIDRTINVSINTPGLNDDLSTFLVGGSCELGAGDVTLSGSGFSPNPVTTPCFNDGGYGSFEYEPFTGIPGTITMIATQIDLAGNVGIDTNVYTLNGPVLPTVTISGPTGSTSTGSNTITGLCTTSAGSVTLSGTGFSTTLGSIPIVISCVNGNYSLPITITGNTTISASQTNAAGTATANASTTLPSSGGGSGGCLPGYSCGSGAPTGTVTTNTGTTPVTGTPTQQPGAVVTIDTTTSSKSCPIFTEYLKKGSRDGRNGISEVSKVQEFLNRKLGLGLVIDGIFGKRTHSAVSTFQSQNFNQVLSPWGLTGPTGWWYQSTRSFANYLENCSEGTVPLDNGVRIQDGMIVN